MALQKKTVIVVLLVIAAVLAAVKFLLKPMTGTKEAAVMETTQEDTTEEVVGDSPVEEEGMAPAGSVPVREEEVTAMEAAAPGVATVETSYSNPGGSDEVSFTLTVDERGVITKAETGVLAKNPTSVKRQESFAAALPGVFVGKKLSELTNIDRVGGSSLTTNAFNASLAKLKSQI